MKEIKQPNTLLLRDVAVYITKMFTIFGTISYSHDAIGFPIDSNIVKLNVWFIFIYIYLYFFFFSLYFEFFIMDFIIKVEQAVMPYLEILANFREKVRNHAKTLKASTILEECDTLRDDILPNIGVRLEDSNNEICKIKLVNREDLLKEKESKKQMELEKMLEKEKKKAEIAAAAVMKEAQRKIPPSEIFKLERDKYSRFDSNVCRIIYNNIYFFL